MKLKFIGFVILYILLIFQSAYSKNPQKILGVWLNTEKDAKIEIYQCGDKICGKILWLKRQEEEGKILRDENNPKENLRNRKLVGLDILKNFEYDEDDNKWVDGKIYDPKSGKTYSCVMHLKSQSTLLIRGYVGISLLGRTVEWTRSN